VDSELALILRARLLIALELPGGPSEPEMRAAARALATEMRAAARALTAHPEDTLGARLVAGMLARHDALYGRPRLSVLALAHRAVGSDAAYASDLEAGYPHMYALVALVMADELELAERRYTAAVERAEQRGSLVGAGIALFQRALIRKRRGALSAAGNDARRALELATRTSENWLIMMAVAALVEVLVEQGDIDTAEATLERHGLAEGFHESPYFLSLALARSAARLAAQRPAEAHADAAAVVRIADALGLRNPIFGPGRSLAALALTALGRPAEARELAHDELAIAEAAELPSAIGTARRVLALATGGDAAVPLLRDAVGVLESAPVPLELARALADLGAALRRGGQRQAAREPLARALELAHRHGAVQLATTARTELHAAGARPRRIIRSGIESLTPSERRIAELAAAGLSNAEIAARLFITVKTAEHHLSTIYRKLGIRSRRELPAALDAAHRKTADVGPNRAPRN
jgi:DNA-binding CsgD family transcriptional regulator